ncbi:MAG: prolyl oligopeptidase family serine peptidase [Acidobacteria bacterium]|nr:prolyl oligopeptidase family serine peptidase [Acidobacteriota bacterium]
MPADPPPTTTPYGAWPSPISARSVAEGARRIDDLAAAGDFVCWLERRPEEGGRNVLVCRNPDGGTRTLTPDGFDVRSRVHEYGGGAFLLIAGAPELPPHAFVNFSDQRVYLATAAGTVPLTPADGARYADLVLDPHRHRLLAVQERPASSGGDETAALVAIPLPADLFGASAPAATEPPQPTELVSGADFFSSPRLSPDGSRLAWLSWNHPDMPWDATALRLADLDENGLPQATRLVAGGDPERPEAVQQPSFDAQGRLVFISDRSGWWNPYRWVRGSSDPLPPKAASKSSPAKPAATLLRAPSLRGSARGGSEDPRTQSLCPRDAEFGVPPWLFGMSTCAQVPGGIVAACCEQGVWGLVLLPDEPAAEPIPIPTPYTSITWLRSAAAPDAGQKTRAPRARPWASAEPSTVVFLGAAPDRPAEVVRLRLSRSDATEPVPEPQLDVLTTTGPTPDPRYLSTGRPIDFPSAEGRRAFAFFYPPKNDDAQAPENARPPLIVKSHGGPTSAAEHVYDPGVQFWTSRGFAVVDVNYGGSTGYGRAYRESLRDRWGIVDVEDCAAAAEALAARGEADPGKLLIRGGSAGGYTTLAALAFRDTFAAGASHYGVADLAALARDTHKFESRYLDRLVGPYPERADLYRERSPLEARDRFSCPVIFFQGDEDRIVPPSQAEAMVEALRAKGVRVDYHLFEGEQHGFRRAENIVRALEAELHFYREVLGVALGARVF